MSERCTASAALVSPTHAHTLTHSLTHSLTQRLTAHSQLTHSTTTATVRIIGNEGCCVIAEFYVLDCCIVVKVLKWKSVVVEVCKTGRVWQRVAERRVAKEVCALIWSVQYWYCVLEKSDHPTVSLSCVYVCVCVCVRPSIHSTVSLSLPTHSLTHCHPLTVTHSLPLSITHSQRYRWSIQVLSVLCTATLYS